MEPNSTLIDQYLESAKQINRHLWASHHAAWKKNKIHKTQVFILYFLRRHHSAHIADIAQAMGTTSSAATQIITGMTKRKFVVRHQAGHDRRQVEVTLTKRGEDLFQRVRLEHLRWLQKYLAPLSAADLRKLISIQAKLLTPTKSKLTHGHYHC